MEQILSQVSITATQILVMFLLILVGIICYRCKLISTEGSKSLTNIALYLATSAVIINSYQIDFDSGIALNLLSVIALAVVSHIFLIIASTGVFKKEKADYQVLRFATVFGNCSFMGIPLLNAILPGIGVMYATAYITVFNVLLWTYGVVLCNKTKEKISLKKIVLSPVILSVIIGFILFLTSVKLPSPLAQTVKYIGDLNTPIAMIVTGVAVAKSNVFSALKKKDVYIVAFLKLIFVSLVMCVILRFLPFLDYNVKLAVTVLSAVPTASTSIMFAGKYGHNYTFASEILVITTVLSLLTLPLSVFFGMLIWG